MHRPNSASSRAECSTSSPNRARITITARHFSIFTTKTSMRIPGTAISAARLERWTGYGSGAAQSADRLFTTDVFLCVLHGLSRSSGGISEHHQVSDAAMAGGDFSQFNRPLYDPDNAPPLAGNIIPQRLLDPVAQNLMSLIPTVPNYGDRYIWSFTDPTINRELLGKLDHNFNNRAFPASELFRHLGAPEYFQHGGKWQCAGLRSANKHQPAEYRHRAAYLDHEAEPDARNQVRHGPPGRRPRQRESRARSFGLRRKLAASSGWRSKVFAANYHSGMASRHGKAT